MEQDINIKDYLFSTELMKRFKDENKLYLANSADIRINIAVLVGIFKLLKSAEYCLKCWYSFCLTCINHLR